MFQGRSSIDFGVGVTHGCPAEVQDVKVVLGNRDASRVAIATCNSLQPLGLSEKFRQINREGIDHSGSAYLSMTQWETPSLIGLLGR